RRLYRSKAPKTNALKDIDINRFHAAGFEIRLMPETGTAGVAQELLPPDTMRIGARPSLERLEVAPVLADTQMWRQQRENKILMGQQPIRRRPGRLVYARAEAKQRFQAGQRVDS